MLSAVISFSDTSHGVMLGNIWRLFSDGFVLSHIGYFMFMELKTGPSYRLVQMIDVVNF